MKVRNIMFSGFAAAILMGTANAAGVAQIASKAYVDSKVGANGTTTQAIEALENSVGDMDDLGDTENSNIDSDTDNLVDAVNDLDAALNTKQDKSNSQVTTAGNHLTAGYGVGGNLEALDSALGAVETKVGSGTLTSTIGSTSVSNIVEAVNALETKTAGQAGSQEVANIQTVLTGDPDNPNDGLVGDVAALQQKVGDGQLASGFSSGVDDLTEAVNDLQSTKQNEADSNVAAANMVSGSHLTAGHGVAANLVALDSNLVVAEGAISTLNTQINGDPQDSTDNGLAGDVAALQNALNDQTNGLTPRVQALENKVGDASSGLVKDVDDLQALTAILDGYSTCLSQAGNGGHCALTVGSDGVEWTPVTLPWVDSEEPAGGNSGGGSNTEEPANP